MPPEDGFIWTEYGRKEIPGFIYPRYVWSIKLLILLGNIKFIEVEEIEVYHIHLL